MAKIKPVSVYLNPIPAAIRGLMEKPTSDIFDNGPDGPGHVILPCHRRVEGIMRPFPTLSPHSSHDRAVHMTNIPRSADAPALDTLLERLQKENSMPGFYGPPKIQIDALHALKMLRSGLESAADALFDAGAYDAWASARIVLNCPEIPDSSVVKESLIPAALAAWPKADVERGWITANGATPDLLILPLSKEPST